MKSTIAFATAGLATWLTGCVTTSVPTQQVASSQAAIRAAEETGAPAVPEANMHLKLAQDEYATARRLMEDGDNERAAYTLLRAESDAEAAVALARQANAKVEADRITDRIEALKAKQLQTSEPGAGQPVDQSAPGTTAPMAPTTPTSPTTPTTPATPKGGSKGRGTQSNDDRSNGNPGNGPNGGGR
jgi:hypothetical protein